jgi:hypothetical protein
MTNPTPRTAAGRGNYWRRTIALGPPYDDGTVPGEDAPGGPRTRAAQEAIELVEALAGWTTAADLVNDLRPILARIEAEAATPDAGLRALDYGDCPHGNGLSCRLCDADAKAEEATWR